MGFDAAPPSLRLFDKWDLQHSPGAGCKEALRLDLNMGVIGQGRYPAVRIEILLFMAPVE